MAFVRYAVAFCLVVLALRVGASDRKQESIGDLLPERKPAEGAKSDEQRLREQGSAKASPVKGAKKLPFSQTCTDARGQLYRRGDRGYAGCLDERRSTDRYYPQSRPGFVVGE